uniref:Uncharacterized protein n=1 Tax=Meloidogyne hapla TaxID=6305 RepID=A0A1I8BCZ0_MELHA
MLLNNSLFILASNMLHNSQKNCEKHSHNGFSYVKDKESADGDRIFCRCDEKSNGCKGRICYEGTLHNVDPLESTISLKNENYRFPNFQPQQRGKQQVNNSNALEVFDKDYDFEKANEQFREDLKGGEGVNLEQSEEKKETEDKDDGCEDGGKTVNSPLAITANDKYSEFYNKQNSFFDNISCDALEKEAGKNVRPDWKRERQTNQETFGYSAVRSFFFQRRGVRRQYGGQRSFGGRPFSGGGHSFGNQMNLFV